MRGGRAYPDIRNDVSIVTYHWGALLEVNPHEVEIGEVWERDGDDEEEDKRKKEKDDSGEPERARPEVGGHVVILLYEV